jgi:predicted dinucleotide-binding enzyme
MRIAIIGTGNVGSAVGRGWAAKDHEVVYGVRDPERPRDVAPLRGVAEAARDADIVVLAVMFHAAEAVLQECGDQAMRYGMAPDRAWSLLKRGD